MKIMYPEKHGTPTVTSADANYPVTNLLDDRRKKVWKAASGVQAATLRVPISADAEAIAVHNTNAETAICTVTLDSAEKALTDGVAVTDLGGGLVGIPCAAHGFSVSNVVLINGTTNYDGVHTLPSQAAGSGTVFVITATYIAENVANTDTACIVVETTTHTLETATRTYDRFYQEYTAQVAAHTATIKLTAATGETVEAGIVRAGVLVDLPNPKYGLTESREDYSIKSQLNNGAWYIRKRDIIRTFSGSFFLARATHFKNLTDIYDANGPEPLSMLLIEDDTDLEWAFFGHILNPFSSSHGYPTHSEIQLQFTEAV